MSSKFLRYSGTYADQYELAMAQVYFLSGRKDDRAVFDYFFRSLPFASGYAVFAGLEDLLTALENLKFDDDELAYLKEQHHDLKFLEYLKNFSFKGDLYSCDEGEIIFPNEPVIRIEGSILEAQLIETLLLNIINFETLIATKATRIRQVAGHRSLLEFGLRRAQGPGGYLASRASIIGGFDGTSHVRAAMDYALHAAGTMAHSFVQSETDELTAFRKFAQFRPEDCVLLIDTYSTLRSGLPNSIIVAKEMRMKGQALKGIRLDSGDLAYFSKECRRILDEHGLQEVKIVASNQLDEYVIESLLKQGAPIDVFGVGTKLVTGYPDGALDGIYKLCEVNGEPKIKLSESVSKINLPHKKQILRVLDHEGKFLGIDAVGLVEEKDITEIYHPIEHLSSIDINEYEKVPLLKLHLKNGGRVSSPLNLREIRANVQNRLGLLPPEYKRFTNAHIYKVGISQKLKVIRDGLIKKYKGKE